MAHEYAVSGGVEGPVPGAYGPAELDGRAEWVPVRPALDVLDALAPRLGSDDDWRKVVLAVLSPLRRVLAGRALGALLAKLPPDLACELTDAEASLCSLVPAATGAGDYLAEVSRLALHPPSRAASYVRAVFAAAKAVLDDEDAEEVAARLPPDIAEIWRAAF